jgi:hypothetical protein
VQQAQGASCVEILLNIFSDISTPFQYKKRLLQGNCTLLKVLSIQQPGRRNAKIIDESTRSVKNKASGIKKLPG